MANETENANIIGPTDVISDAIAAALVQGIVVVPLIASESVPENTAVKLFRQEGSLAATDGVAESSAYSFSSSSEYTETSVSATAAKTVVASKITVEALRFKNFDVAKTARLQGEALARTLDDNVLALFSGFNNGVTAASIATPDIWLDGVYTVNSSLAGLKGRNLTGVADYKAINELRKHLINSGATAYSHQSMITLLEGKTTPTGYAGSLPGADLYETDGLPTTGGDDIGLVFNPEMAFGAMYDSSVTTNVVWVGSSGLWWEVTSYIFNKVVEWVDAAGCKVRSDT